MFRSNLTKVLTGLLVFALSAPTMATQVTLATLRQVIEETLGVEAATITALTHLQDDLELDDYDREDLILAVEEAFSVEIPDEEAEKFQTVDDILKYVQSQKAQ